MVIAAIAVAATTIERATEHTNTLARDSGNA